MSSEERSEFETMKKQLSRLFKLWPYITTVAGFLGGFALASVWVYKYDQNIVKRPEYNFKDSVQNVRIAELGAATLVNHKDIIENNAADSVNTKATDKRFVALAKRIGSNLPPSKYVIARYVNDKLVFIPIN